MERSRVEQIAADLRAGVEIKERRFRLKTYPATFLGTDAVQSLKEAEDINTSEAIKLGNLLIREKVFHHVCDDHLLENGKLFYRFYADEEKLHSEEKSEKKTMSSASSSASSSSASTTQQQVIQLRLSVDRDLSNAEAERKNIQLRFEGLMYEYERSIQTLLRVVLVLSFILICIAAFQLFVAVSGWMSNVWGSLLVTIGVGYGVFTIYRSAQTVASRHGVESLLDLLFDASFVRSSTTTSTTTTNSNNNNSGSNNSSGSNNNNTTTSGSNTTTSKSSLDNALELIPSSLDVSKLLVEHAVEIRKLQKLAPAPDITDSYMKYDDIFYLRYILSFGSAEKAKDPVEYTFQFRSDKIFQQLAKKIANNEFVELPGVIESKKWQVGAPLDNVLSKETGGGVAVMIRMGMCNMSMMHDRISKKNMYEMNLGQREAAYQRTRVVLLWEFIICQLVSSYWSLVQI